MTSAIEQAKPATRSQAFGLITGGVALGLTIPTSIDLHAHNSLNLRADDYDTEAVYRWAAYLNLPEPARVGRVHALDSERPWTALTSSVSRRSPMLPDWSIQVWCLVVATPDEIAAALAKAEVAGGVK